VSIRTRRLRLDCDLDTIEGNGEQLVFKVKGGRLTKNGTHERYELELSACRYSVRQLLAQIRKMHLRDRERITWEFQRIDREIAELTKEEE
jgi:hypothetical protein